MMGESKNEGRGSGKLKRGKPTDLACDRHLVAWIAGYNSDLVLFFDGEKGHGQATMTRRDMHDIALSRETGGRACEVDDGDNTRTCLTEVKKMRDVFGPLWANSAHLRGSLTYINVVFARLCVIFR